MARQSWAVVTGASSGIGLEIAKLLAGDGINVVIAARDKDALETIATDLRKRCFVQVKVYAGDLSKQLVVRGLYDFCQKHQLKVEYLVNSAGIGNFAPLITADWRELKLMMQLNIVTLAELTYLFAKDMALAGTGKILNVASVAAFLSGPNMATYYASKAFVLHFSEALHQELSNKGVSVTTLCPGPTESNFAKAAHAASTGPFRGKLDSAEQVARCGYNAMKKGQAVAIYGLKNKIGLWLTRFIPRSKLVQYIARVQR